jgi:hypothetical protein
MGLIALYYHVFSIAYKLYQRYFLAVRWMDARESDAQGPAAGGWLVWSPGRRPSNCLGTSVALTGGPK